jgi:CRISPR-associated endonuclease/helicase Cas3
MTATLTDDYIQFIKETFDFEVVSLKDFPNDACKIKSLKPSENKSVKKSITVCKDKKINATDILDKHKNKTIVICNRVEKAQQLYDGLCKLVKDTNCNGIEENNIICLHSRFFDKDRKEKETKLKQLFGKGSSENAILISTQVIEAGMDISCDVMHTEISPVNSFLQRAGRCARFENEYGEIFVYDILDLEEKEKISEDGNEADKKEIKKLNNKYLPYDKTLCETSLSELRKYNSIDENSASALVDTVLKDEEKQTIDTITQRFYNKDKILESWKDCDKKHYRETIRDIQSIEIVLLDVENLRNEKIITWQYETISVYKWSFISWAKQVTENRIDIDDWIFAKAELSTDSCFDFEWQDKDTYLLRQLHIEDIKNHYDVIFVDNRYFNYTENAGFLIAMNDDCYISPVKQINKEDKPIIAYKKDTFYQHNKALLNCFETEFKPYLKFAFQELDKYWGEKIDWEYLIKIAICFHDYGKLNNSWQKIVKEFQKRKSGIDNPNEILAHTDYNEITDKELAKSCGMNKKPPHAGIGANQVYEMLYDTYSEEVATGVANAILKHHNTETISSDSFSICNTGKKEIENLMKEYKIDGIIKDKLPKENELGIMPKEQKEWLLYLFIVRILRLCDQKATESLEKYYTI